MSTVLNILGFGVQVWIVCALFVGILIPYVHPEYKQKREPQAKLKDILYSPIVLGFYLVKLHQVTKIVEQELQKKIK